MINEEWKIIEVAKKYEVSNLGRVRRIGKTNCLKLVITWSGYARVCLINNNKETKYMAVHRLVAQAFIPNPLNKPCVNHKDYIRSNNIVSNLEWVTRSENNLWSRERIGEGHRGLKRKLSTRKKVSNYVSTKKNRELPTYIYYDKGYYVFLIRRFEKTVVAKSFKDLNKAIEYKDNWLKEHKGEIEHYYEI